MRKVKFVIQDLDITVVAELLEDLNPGICNSIWEVLPYESTWVHTMVSGQLMYFWIPMVHTASPEYSELFSQELVGRINYSYVYQSICIKYGEEVTEPTSANPWAQVLSEHLKDLYRLGEAVWESNYLTHRPIRGILYKEEE